MLSDVESGSAGDQAQGSQWESKRIVCVCACVLSGLGNLVIASVWITQSLCSAFIP